MQEIAELNCLEEEVGRKNALHDDFVTCYKSKSTVIVLLWHDTLKGVIIPFGRDKFQVNAGTLNKS